MRRWLALAMVFTLGVAACGGGDDDSNDAASDDSSATTADDSTDGTTGDSEIDALIERAKAATIRVTYETDGGTAFTMSQDGDNRALIQEDGQKLLEVDGHVYTCSGGESGQCMQMPDQAEGLTSMMMSMFGMYALVAIPDVGENPLFDVTKTEDREIAGRSATCTTLEAGMLAGTDGSITACLDDETGVFLLGETESDSDNSRIEATEVGEPQDADFELTGDVTTIPS